MFAIGAGAKSGAQKVEVGERLDYWPLRYPQWNVAGSSHATEHGLATACRETCMLPKNGFVSFSSIGAGADKLESESGDKWRKGHG